MDRFELFALLGTDVCLERRHVVLELDRLTGLDVDGPTLLVQNHRRWTENGQDVDNASKPTDDQ